ncbi:MAG TPA: antitoxin [Terrimesophilobacter sp.]|uniref:FitA-like ribbon-helix-helix domain-containing protein n=1 Tax=Terrimesophilobacter sp. TaxID=2906435 RepID=UPI002F9369E8
MPKMLQVRNLPDEVHARLKERAAQERMSLSDYVAQELTKLVRYRSNAEIVRDARMKTFDIPREEMVEGIRRDRESH